MSCMPLFRPRTKATELAITIAKWTTGTGIHLHDNVVSHLRLHLAGKNLALLVMILVICIYIYIICIYLLYMSCCYASRAQGERQKLTIWTCVPTGLQERICVQKIGWRCKANTHTQTHSVPCQYIINYHKVFSKTLVLSHWVSGPCTFSRQHRLTWRLLVLTSLLLGISFSWPALLLTVLSLEISFFWHFFLEGKQMQKATMPQQFALPSNSSAALQNTRTHYNTH